MNWSAAVSQTSRSKFECAAAGFQHRRASEPEMGRASFLPLLAQME
jgi:hypothetical protein